MWLSKDSLEKKDASNQLIAVAIDRDKGSQIALKWAIDNLLQRGQIVVLVHVKVKNQVPSPSIVINGRNWDQQTKDLFLPFRCFCTRKDIQCRDIVLEDTEVTKALVEFVSQAAIEVLIMGSASKGSLFRFNKADNPATISKSAPDFCTVYVISKAGKISSMRSAARPAPSFTQLRSQILNQPSSSPTRKGPEKSSPAESPSSRIDDIEFRSPFGRGGRHPHVKSYGEIMAIDTDISFVSSGRSSVDRMFPPLYEPPGSNRQSTSSDNTDYTYETARRKSSVDILSSPEFSTVSSNEDSSIHWSNIQPQAMDDAVEAEMRRLRLELRQTMDMYSNACKEALTAKQKAMELQRWKLEEERRNEDIQNSEESTQTILEKERAKSKAAMESAEAHKRIAELESRKRISLEMKALKDSENRNKSHDVMSSGVVRYRRYTIDEIEVATEYFAESRKIGEGGYGPVFRCYLDHTLVAVKVLRPDAAQGRSQFQQEVEVLSCIRHPNMVLLLGACPEYGCLVYEYMHNGSLEDRLFCRGGTPPLSWQHRFRIAAEIATGLLFLHQTKPEPLVHRDLKPANILLDRNLVSKISDVGLARLVPPSMADDVTQYRMTSTAGTFCYIDPEYQQTGMLGVKSDVYSLGIMLLQIVTGKSPMGLAHHVERALERGTFEDMLDPSVPDWPVNEVLSFAKMSVKCAELRRRDRPDLGTVVLPELCRLRNLAEESLDAMMFRGGGGGASGYEGYRSTSRSQATVSQDLLSGPPSHEE
ncbi:U-box domain-containing protein 35-like isoform X2 [Silene latifolia]|uniref:U-box domain-containing protein 35-like isoform X2 n=1 Tax=Silene latifolia TaxID=37657 RepID=UPI003D76E183